MAGSRTLTSLIMEASPMHVNLPPNQLDQLEEGKYWSGDEAQVTPPIALKIVAELIGTYILIFMGCGSLLVDQRSSITLVGVALVWATVVVALVYTLGHISGAHLNPAITVAFAAIGRFPWKHVAFYFVAQMIGATAASFTLRGLFRGEKPEAMLSLPGSSTTDMDAIVMEIIVSFILMFVICSASDSRAVKELTGVAIGAAVFFCVITAGTISGCSMNPARSFGPAVAMQNFHKIFIYLISPVIGTVAGATLYRCFRAPTAAVKMGSKRIEPVDSGKQAGTPHINGDNAHSLEME